MPDCSLMGSLIAFGLVAAWAASIVHFSAWRHSRRRLSDLLKDWPLQLSSKGPACCCSAQSAPS